MKNITLITLIFLVSINSSCQQTNNKNSYDNTKGQIELLLPELKSSYDSYKKYYNLVDWDEEFNHIELSREEYLKKSSKIDVLENLYNKSIKQQDLLMDSIVKIIARNIPEKEQAKALESFNKGFNQIKLSRNQVRMQTLELRTKLLNIKIKSK